MQKIIYFYCLLTRNLPHVSSVCSAVCCLFFPLSYFILLCSRESVSKQQWAWQLSLHCHLYLLCSEEDAHMSTPESRQHRGKNKTKQNREIEGHSSWIKLPFKWCSWWIISRFSCFLQFSSLCVFESVSHYLTNRVPGAFLIIKIWGASSTIVTSENLTLLKTTDVVCFFFILQLLDCLSLEILGDLFLIGDLTAYRCYMLIWVTASQYLTFYDVLMLWWCQSEYCISWCLMNVLLNILNVQAWAAELNMFTTLVYWFLQSWKK